MPVWLLNLIIGVVLSVASNLLQQAFAPKPESRTGTRGSTLFGGKVPQYFLVGTIGEAGKREYRNTWGSAGGVPNAYLTDVYSFGDLPITALARLFVNGVVEPISTSGHVTQGYPTTGDKAGSLWIEFFDGTQTTANSFLTAKFGSDPDRPWLSDMIGRGVPYLTATALWSEKVWTGFPEVVGEFQGIPLYDVTKDTTAGGEGDQRWDTPSTWAFSDNNAVIIYNILRGIHYGGERVWGGSTAAAQLPYDVWAAAIEACDEDVTLDGGGTEKRFRAGRRIALNERPADVIRDLLIGCNGRISHAADGTVYILVGVPDEAEGGFSDADVLATEPLGTIPFPNLDEVINGATATYREPEQAWEDKETAPHYRSDLEDEDDGRRQVEGLDLGTTFSGTQAQRILKAVIEEGRRFRRHVVALPPEFAIYRPLSVLAWTSDRFDYTAKLFLVTARTIDPFGNVVLGLQEIDPADHAWEASEDEQPLSYAPVVINRPPAQAMTGWSVAPDVIVDASATSRRPAIRIEFDGGLQDVRAVRWQVRLDGETEIVAEGETPYDITEVTPARLLSGGWTLPNTDYELRAKYLPFSGRETEWSSWLDVTTPNVKLTEDDVNVDVNALVGDVLGQLGQIRSLITQFKELGTLVEEMDRENFHLRNSLFREISVQMGDLQASFTEIIEVALGPGGAIATALESLYAAMGGNTSEVNVRWEAVAAPSGYSARYAITAAVNDGSFRSATFFIDVPADPDDPTRIVMVGDQVVIANPDGSVVKTALVVEDGEIKFEGARAGRITDPTGGDEMVIDFDDPEILMLG